MACVVYRLSRIALSAVLIIAFTFIQGALTAGSQENENLFVRTIEGQAVVINDDLTRTRDIAIRDALRRAVVDAVDFLALDSNSVDKLNDQQIEKYVYQYGILSEKQSGILYSVEVKVDIDKRYLKNDFKSRSGDNRFKEITIDAKGIKHYNDYSRVKNFLVNRTNGKGRIIPKMIKSDQVIFGLYTDEKIDGLVEKLANLTSTSRTRKISSNIMEIDIGSN